MTFIALLVSSGVRVLKAKATVEEAATTGTAEPEKK
jgi:hypothetical protein